MSLIKSYFLFLAKKPIVYHLFFLLFVVLAVFFWAAFLLFFHGEYRALFFLYHFLIKIFYLSFFFCSVHFILVSIIKKKYITCPDNLKSTWYNVFVYKDGQKVIFDKPVWAKGRSFSILAISDNFCDSYCSCDSFDEFLIKTKMDVKFKKIVVDISFLVKLIPKDNFNKLELFENLISYKGDCENVSLLNFNDYLIKKIAHFNRGNKKSIKKILAKYSKSEISEMEFLNNLAKIFVFEKERYFSMFDVVVCPSLPQKARFNI